VGPAGLVVAPLVGVVLVGSAPRLVVLLARAGAAFATAVLGPDRAELMAARVDALTRQRAEILEAVVAERRRIERNLHDGVQQRLVALGIDLGMAAGRVHTDPDGAAALIADARDQTRTAIGELRVLGRGLHPAILDDRGLDAALSAVVASSTVPMRLSVQPGLEVPLGVAETAYYVVSEAVTNTMKHARARSGSIGVAADGDRLVLEIHDDGRGGADIGHGTGLAGMRARVEGLDGIFRVSSPPGGPTVVHAELPLVVDQSEPGRSGRSTTPVPTLDEASRSGGAPR
jgi:signal transduction histidine kinase